MVDDVMPQDLSFDQEEWRPIPGIPGYEASSLGRLRSLPWTIYAQGEKRTYTQHHKGKILRKCPQANEGGVLYNRFNSNVKGATSAANRAVCMAFYGLPPTSTHQAAHINGNSLDDRPSNLMWATPKQNGEHKVLHGTSRKGKIGLRGSAAGPAKLTEDVILGIFEAYADGETATSISKRIGVNRSHLHAILTRIRWNHMVIPDDLLDRVKLMARR